MSKRLRLRIPEIGDLLSVFDLNSLARLRAILRMILSVFWTFISQTRVLSSAK